MYRIAVFAFVLAPSMALNSFGQVDVIVRGQLRTGIFAIGGETTGTTITAKNITYELNLANKAELLKAADQLNGKQAIVEGRLNRKKGVEVSERWIVDVSRMNGGDGADGKDVKKEETKNSESDLSASGHKPTTVVKIADCALVDIQCPFGIDRMTLKRTSDQWATELAIRIHISRMESFVVESETIRAETSFGDKPRGVRVTDAKTKEKVATKEDWLRVGRFGNQKEGYFLIELRPPLLEKNPESLEISWVDAYRN